MNKKKIDYDDLPEIKGVKDGKDSFLSIFCLLVTVILITFTSCYTNTYTEGYSSIDKYEVSDKKIDTIRGEFTTYQYKLTVRNNTKMLNIETDAKSFSKVKDKDSILIVTKTIIKVPKK